jgi:Flp pilus assembly protein TadG
VTRRLRRRDERGVAVLETALVVPFLMILAIGIWEFSNGWQNNLAVQASVRAAARTGAGLGNDRAADFSMLQALKSGLTDFAASDIQRVVIFDASSSATVPATCKAGTSVAGSCNVYTGAQVNSVTYPSPDFAGTTTTCASPALDRYWCPTGRDVSQASPDYVGVYVKAFSRYQTGYFPGSGIAIEKTMVMRLEPKVSG